MRTLILLSAIASIAGCGVNKNNFSGQFLEIDCARMEECDKGTFENLYSSVDDCVARLENLGTSTSECLAGHCEFDKDNANQCLDELKGSDCGDIDDGSAYADCADVWTACDGSEGECVDAGTTPMDDTAAM